MAPQQVFGCAVSVDSGSGRATVIITSAAQLSVLSVLSNPFGSVGVVPRKYEVSYEVKVLHDCSSVRGGCDGDGFESSRECA